MDESSFSPNNNPPLPFGNIDEFMDQLFDEGCWLQTVAPGSNISLLPEPQNSISLSYSNNTTDLISVPHHQGSEEGKWSTFSKGLPSSSQQPGGVEEDDDNGDPRSREDHQKLYAIQALKKPSSQSKDPFSWDVSNEFNTIWIAPQASPGPSSSVKQRLMSAILRFNEMSEDKDVLIQIWVPIKKEQRNFLTTVEQPYFRDPGSTRLVNYRNVSEKYQFLADEDSKEALGLPGRVYLGRVPEWTPDVRFFGPDEYPRIGYAHMYDVRGSIALPVFERGSANCLGVVELVMTTQKANYRPEVETVCRALEAVDLRSSSIHWASEDKAGSESYKAALPEILHILSIICDKHNLPLAQTWAPCIQQGKTRCWNSDRKSHCISTIDSACYIRDPRVSEFHEACSEHHLLGNQGIVGQAFVTNQPSFATDVTAFSKSDYPLSHHGKMFGLRAAVAIRIRSVVHGESSTDFILELFLPSADSQNAGLAFHFEVIESLSMMIQQGCQNIRLLTTDEGQYQQPEGAVKEISFTRLGSGRSNKSSTAAGDGTISWISDMVEAKRKGKEVAVSFSEDEQKDGFRLTTDDYWDNSADVEELLDSQLFPGFGNMKHDFSVEDVIQGSSSFSERLSLGSARKAREKRKTKAQKTISLQALRQYFSGSLKDAAKNIGVCPTTLKRICRQHGITRWPSRKIKKVGHSLKKLQTVIDSVQGAEGSIKLSSFYSNFPELCNPNTSGTNRLLKNTSTDDQTQQQTVLALPQDNSNMFGSKSPSTSSSHTSSSSHSISTGVKTSPTITAATPEVTNPPIISLKRARSEAELRGLNQKLTDNLLERSQSNRSLAADHLKLRTNQPPDVPTNTSLIRFRDGGPFKAKVTSGQDTIRFSILPNMGFRDVVVEVAKRFDIDDVTSIQIKYLDDDKEWVLMTCDADLDECIDIQRSTGSRTAKLSVSPANSTSGTPFGSSGKS